MTVDLSHMAVAVEHRFTATPEQVWALLSDLPAMAALSPEVQQLSWTGRSTFTATNRRGGHTWTVPGSIVDRDPPRLLRWTVLEPDRPSSTWSFALVPVSDGTLVRHVFAHGPGPSFVRAAVEADPSRLADVVEGRLGVLAGDMAATLRAAEAVLRARS